MGYIENIEKLTKENEDFRRVLYTAKNSQLVLMSLEEGEEIGEEVHQLDQFLRIEEGVGRAVLDGISHNIGDGFAILVPAGAKHNVINTGNGKLKLYTLYSPPNHKNGIIHKTKSDAEADQGDHFDGVISE